MIIYRKSKNNDRENINNLLKICFGERENYGALDNLEGRYLLAFENEKLVAMTGVMLSSPAFCGSEVDWTCVLPEFRGNGLVTNMLKEALKETKCDVFCSCLRLHENDKVNLYHAMNENDFVCLIKNYKTFKKGITKACFDCVYDKGENCFCSEDLYIRRAKGCK